jgi:hypothetical protein
VQNSVHTYETKKDRDQMKKRLKLNLTNNEVSSDSKSTETKTTQIAQAALRPQLTAATTALKDSNSTNSFKRIIFNSISFNSTGSF